MNYILTSYKKIILWKDTCEFLGPWDPPARLTPRLMIRPGIATSGNRRLRWSELSARQPLRLPHQWIGIPVSHRAVASVCWSMSSTSSLLTCAMHSSTLFVRHIRERAPSIASGNTNVSRPRSHHEIQFKARSWKALPCYCAPLSKQHQFDRCCRCPSGFPPLKLARWLGYL
jgi:hypothetical protein